MKLVFGVVFLLSVVDVLSLSVKHDDRDMEDLDGESEVSAETEILLEKILSKLKAKTNEKQQKAMGKGLAMEKLFYMEFHNSRETKAMFDLLDMDKSGTITVSDFSGFLRKTGKSEIKLSDFETLKEDDLLEYTIYFNEIDTDKDGYWEKTEVAAHWAAKYLELSDADWKSDYIDKADENKDGKISLTEAYEHLHHAYGRDE